MSFAVLTTFPSRQHRKKWSREINETKTVHSLITIWSSPRNRLCSDQLMNAVTLILPTCWYACCLYLIESITVLVLLTTVALQRPTYSRGPGSRLSHFLCCARLRASCRMCFVSTHCSAASIQSAYKNECVQMFTCFTTVSYLHSSFCLWLTVVRFNNILLPFAHNARLGDVDGTFDNITTITN